MKHTPVLINEVLDGLLAKKYSGSRKVYVDATLGGGGHASKFLELGYFVVGIDADKDMLKIARECLEACPSPKNNFGGYELIRDNFRNIEGIINKLQISKPIAVLADLGVSVQQLKHPLRGFSFTNKEAVLDMRVDPESQAVLAKDLLNSLPEKHLQSLFAQVLNYKKSKILAGRVVARRKEKRIETVGDFLKIGSSVSAKKSGLHPATLPFTALRIAVNSELENLKEFLKGALRILEVGGRLAVISFHSGEDKIVKDYFTQFERQNIGIEITRKPITPTAKEVEDNLLSRSAKLRVFEKKIFEKYVETKTKTKVQNFR